MKYIRGFFVFFFNFQILEVKFSVYLNRYVFVMSYFRISLVMRSGVRIRRVNTVIFSGSDFSYISKITYDLT